MKKMIVAFISSITFLLLFTGCANTEEGTFVPASDEQTQTAIEFVNDYKEDMIYHTNQGSFSELEPYLVPNSTFYHLVRRHVSDLQQERSTLTLIEHTVSDVLINEFDEFHVNAYEMIETTDRHGKKVTEELNITYELIEYNDIFRIVTIMKR
ncbi:hypothetical protein BTR23_04625 [Alkalihalophilus pseudofirmus]|uniref:TcaA NTF2-like domain-containing protein n=1 Tax=Alkalihalobacterium alkalinitrilicum TaxID=427920 RepID=UPI00094C0247|nr:hypothetical protein [Alkalihalobacterium alkalinitrilicum]OLO40762.1 hypothetical protein BTR23_04625 [Alkalihalophilus pseudofirmus]